MSRRAVAVDDRDSCTRLRELPGDRRPDDPDTGDDDPGKWLYIEVPTGSAKTLTIQVVWDDGSGSEIVTYRPCDNIGEGGTCARIKKIGKPKNKLSAPKPEEQSR